MVLFSLRRDFTLTFLIIFFVHLMLYSGNLEFLAMPDQVHNSERDFCYFVLDDWFCVACYQQIATSKLRERTKDMTRATVQKSLCYFTKNFNYTPLGLSYLRAKMQETVDAYFSASLQGSFDDKSLLTKLYQDMPALNAMVSSPTTEIPEHRYLKNSPVLRLLARFGRTALSLFKLLLLEKKVVIYGVPAGDTSDLILALTSLMPLFYEKHAQIDFITEGANVDDSSKGSNTSSSTNSSTKSVSYSANETEYANLKLPLKIASYTFVSGSVVLSQADWLCTLPSYYIGTCNTLFAQWKQVLDYDACFDANLAHLNIPNPMLANTVKLTPEDTIFMDHILSKVQIEAHNDDPFAEFLLVDDLEPDASGIAGAPADGGQQHTPGTVSSWYSKETWVRTMFAAYVKALLAGATMQNNGTHANGRVDAYGGHFLLDWAQTRNFKKWHGEIDIRAIHADPAFNTLAHPAFSLPQAPKTIMGKGIQMAKGSISTLTSTTTNFVSTIGNVWNQRTQQKNVDGWGLDGTPAPPSTSASASAALNVNSPAPAPSPSSSGLAQGNNAAQPPSYGSVSSPAAQQYSAPAPHVVGSVDNQIASSQYQTGQPSNKSLSGFFESVKQKISSPFGRNDRAERTAAQFEHMSLDGAAPIVVQPAQVTETAPQPTQQQKPAPRAETPVKDTEEDLLGF